MPRIGFGVDVHRLSAGLPLTIGGVRIPYEAGFVAHSDGDVLIHALCDALLGAAALGDIGRHFPDTDEQYSGIDSRELLRKTVGILARENWSVVNVDCTLAMQRPKIAPYVEAMRRELAACLGVGVEQVSVKATTTECLGYEGRGEGATAYAVAMIERMEAE